MSIKISRSFLEWNLSILFLVFGGAYCSVCQIDKCLNHLVSELVSWIFRNDCIVVRTLSEMNIADCVHCVHSCPHLCKPGRDRYTWGHYFMVRCNFHTYQVLVVTTLWWMTQTWEIFCMCIDLIAMSRFLGSGVLILYASTTSHFLPQLLCTCSILTRLMSFIAYFLRKMREENLVNHKIFFHGKMVLKTETQANTAHTLIDAISE